MKTLKSKLMIVFAFMFFISFFALAQNNNKTLFHDDFSGLKPQMISGGVIGALAEYNTIDAVRPKGNWSVGTFRSDESQRAWRLIVEDKKHIMYQSYEANLNEREYTHPILLAGDTLWNDYTVDVAFSAENKMGLSGVLFRYQTNRHYYFFGVRGDSALIMKVNGSNAFRVSNQVVLAKEKFDWKPEELLNAKIDISGTHIKATINGVVSMEANDPDFQKGKIGLMSDIPTKYYSVNVTADPSAYNEYQKRKDNFNVELADLRDANPKPVLWKKINTPNIGTGRSLRFGDLDNDGEMDILIGQVLNHGPKDRNSELGCLTAINLDGEVLWQIGEPDPWNDKLTSDVAFQIYDIDGDGKNEVIYCKDMKLIIADGETGETKYSIDTPINKQAPPYDKFPRILGDAIYICNVEGLERPQNILLKDRYENFYIYNNKLELLWTGTNKVGHYPFAWDINGNGKDDIAIGYSLYDSDGKQLFSQDEKLKDHSDGVAIVKLKENGPFVMFYAASDEGTLFSDLDGNILHHHHVGHAQNPVICNLRDDLPGMEVVTVNFWATQGIVTFYNSDMEIYKTFEPFHQATPMLPTNWTGKSEELLTLSTDPNIGGMIDGYGRKVVTFPADGHPDMCYAVMDIMGDCRDEIVTWDASEIWIYTQSDNPKSGNLYEPIRNPLYNFSNYSVAVSYPLNWIEESNSTFKNWKEYKFVNKPGWVNK